MPVPVSGLSSGAAAISAGWGEHACALTAVGSVLCWGDDQLGSDTQTGSLVPVAVAGLASGVAAIAVGYAHTCALTTAGGVLCWGANGNGQLGDGSNIGSQMPLAVWGLSSDVVGISAGWAHTCAVTTAGAVLCWGSNDGGQLGDGTQIDRLTPVQVLGP